VQKPQPLGRDIREEKINAGRVAARPGKAGDETKLDRVCADAKTIGIVVVAALAASAAGLLPDVAITATWRRTRSAMSDGSRSYWPSSQWYSTVTF
jgi:hypothetical protein